MSVDDWRKDKRGQVILNSLLEYETTIGNGSFVCLRVRCAHDGAAHQEPDCLQLVLTPHQTALLARDLMNAAAAATHRPQ